MLIKYMTEQEISYLVIVSTDNVIFGISRKTKSTEMPSKKSEESIVPVMIKTEQLSLGKGLYFNNALVGGK